MNHDFSGSHWCRGRSLQSFWGGGLVVFGLLFCSASTVRAELSNLRYYTDITGAESAGDGATDVKIVSGVVDSPEGASWTITVSSANNGRLVGPGGPARGIAYNTIRFVKVGGVLGSGLTDPSGAVKSVTSGACAFSAGLQPSTSATVSYAFELRIGWSPDETRLGGVYQDTITVTFSLVE